ncbi:hypothetical protein [Bradyrhizobium genosp. A]|uniref:hypothetical protein n=1 Tax=Bradyrhizobium genosp. A TaxID=83626 RepID=UPI003CF0623D
MAIPTPNDHALAELEALHGVVMVRCRTLLRAGQRRDKAAIVDALAAYVDAAVEFANGLDR